MAIEVYDENLRIVVKTKFDTVEDGLRWLKWMFGNWDVSVWVETVAYRRYGSMFVFMDIDP